MSHVTLSRQPEQHCCKCSSTSSSALAASYTLRHFSDFIWRWHPCQLGKHVPHLRGGQRFAVECGEMLPSIAIEWLTNSNTTPRPTLYYARVARLSKIAQKV